MTSKFPLTAAEDLLHEHVLWQEIKKWDTSADNFYSRIHSTWLLDFWLCHVVHSSVFFFLKLETLWVITAASILQLCNMYWWRIFQVRTSRLWLAAFVCVSAYASVCMHACVRACVCTCVRVCVCSVFSLVEARWYFPAKRLCDNKAECADAALTVGVMDPALTWSGGHSSEERFILLLSIMLTHRNQAGCSKHMLKTTIAITKSTVQPHF